MAYSYRVPLCVPFWSKATYWSLLKTILSGAVIQGENVHKLQRVVSDNYSVPYVLLCNNGRGAIWLALRAFGIQPGHEVIVPSFCCQSVLEPILKLGATPVFSDIGDDLNVAVNSLEPCFTDRTAAVIVPHLFGNPADIETIVEICHARGIKVIDDAAQAVGATINKRLLGTFGDAGVLSFGNGKVCFGTGGGVLLSNQAQLVELATLNLTLPVSSWDAVLHALSILVWRRWRSWTLPINMGLSKFHKREKPDKRLSHTELLRNLDASIALSLLDSLQENLKRRREHVMRYHRNLGTLKELALVPHNEGSSHLAQVVQLNPDTHGNSRKEEITRKLQAKGYEIIGSYTPLHLLSPYQRFVRRPLNNVERKWSHLVELPTEPSVSDEDIDRISEIVVQSLN